MSGTSRQALTQDPGSEPQSWSVADTEFEGKRAGTPDIAGIGERPGSSGFEPDVAPGDSEAAPPRHHAPGRDPIVVPLGYWSRVALGIAAVLGAVAFCWPFLISVDTLGDVAVAPLLFGVLLVLVLLVGFAQIAEGGIDAKALALLGVLSAVNAGLRPLGAGTSGIELVFFLLVLAGRVFGPGFGFLLGCTSLFASAIITGGVGPWLPYQMFGAAFIGLGAGLLPRCRGRAEIALLALYGFFAAYLYGLLLNLSFWPFVVDPASTTAYVPGAANGFNLRRYVIFDAATSLGWDTLRAFTNVVLIVLTGPAILAALRRAGRRAAFEAPVAFAAADVGADARPNAAGAESGVARGIQLGSADGEHRSLFVDEVAEELESP